MLLRYSLSCAFTSKKLRALLLILAYLRNVG